MKTYPVITISREHGSGGHEMGRMLAEELGIPFYDNEIIAIAAKDSGFAEQAFEEADKRASSSLLYSLSRLGSGGTYSMPLNDQLFMIQSGIIRTVADRGPAVIVGRCADYVLRSYTKCIHIFAYADVESRVRRIMEERKLSRLEALEFLKRTDKSRAAYYNYYTDQKWGSRQFYDLCINTGLITLETAVGLIRDYVNCAWGGLLEQAKREAKP
mgnify:CR=1 FL=1